MNKLRVFESFCGYGSQSIALENIGVPHEVVAISDIDADVLISYGAIRGDLNKSISLSDDEIKQWLMDKNIGWDFQKQKSSIPRMKKDKLYKLYNTCVQHNCLGDISIIEPNSIPDHDLFTYSFPCQDISVAGNQKGLEKGGGTRSGLLWECEKIIAAKKPKYLLMENVKNLVGKKFKADFDKWCSWLEEQGYKNFYKVLNAKDYGVPQNRERVFMVSILDENATYEFPEKFPLELRLKDVLEDIVEDKYYIDNEASNRLLSQLKDKDSLLLDMCQAKREGKPREYTEVSSCLSARDYKEPRLINCGNVNPSGNGMNGNVFDSDGLAPTVTTNKGEGQKIVIDKSINNPKEIDNANCITSREDRGISNRKSEGTAVLEKVIIDDTQGFEDGVRTYDEYSPTLRSQRSGLKTIECGAIRGRYEDDGSIKQKLEINGEESSNTITTVQKDNMIAEKTDGLDMVGMLDIRGNEQIRRVYGDGGVSQTLNTMQGGNRQPKVAVREATKQGYAIAEVGDSINFEQPNSKTRRGRVGKQVAQTLTTSCNQATLGPTYRIRKLTPKECWRLMGMKDEHFDRCVDAGISNSGLYKQAGNSIVVDVLEYIFKELFKEYIVSGDTSNFTQPQGE